MQNCKKQTAFRTYELETQDQDPESNYSDTDVVSLEILIPKVAEGQASVYLEQSRSDLDYLSLDGEYLLLYAVLERALKTITAQTSNTTQLEVSDALSWLLGHGVYSGSHYSTYVFSANMICSYLEINYDNLKDRIKKWSD